MDIISIVAGAVVATALAVVIFTQRHRIQALGRSVGQQATSVRERLTRGAEASYREAVAEMANGLHLAGHLVPLERIAVVPRFYTLPPPYDPLEEDNPAYDQPHHLLPLIPDWPEVIGPYHVPSIPIERLLRGEGRIALLGQPGSGRTVALALTALLVARQTEPAQPGGLLDEKRVPVYFHLADVNLDPAAYEPGTDPLLPLLDAARPHLRGLAVRLMGAVQGVLAAGHGLILADGWDEIAPSHQRRVAAWLRVVLDSYPGNKIVIAGPVSGCGLLLHLGLAPVYLLPWSNADHAELGRRWADAWPEIGGTAREPAPAPTDDLIRRAVRGNRARSPLDVTLHVWATYAADDPGEGRIGWYRAYIRRVVPAADLVPALHRLAERLLLVDPTEEHDSHPGPGLPLEAVTALIGDVARTLDGRPSMSTPDFLYTITSQTRVLTEHTGQRLTFSQPLVGAFLAAEALRGSEPHDKLLEEGPVSRLVMPFLAQLQTLTPYVEHRLAAPDTILRNHLLEMAAWAADADLRASWRSPVFKRLADLLLGSAEYPAIRERVMAAMVASRDPNVAFVFREGLKSREPRLRMLSVFGLGALGDPESVVTLGEMIEDPDPTVEVAAGLALGAIGTKTALNYMIQMLLTASDLARRGVAEMLAATNVAGEGHDVLREAADEADPAARKAAIYGLARVGQPWAVQLIEALERRDDQWMVRATAGAYMDRIRAGEQHVLPPARPLRPEEIDWLGFWLDGRGESAAPGPQGISQLVRAMQEGDDATRLAAVEVLGALASADAAKPLYAALLDEHPEIRDSAYRALAAISRISGRPLPGVLS